MVGSLMSVGSTFGSIVTNGLTFLVDSGNLGSYSGTGTTWKDLSPSATNATLINSPSFSTGNGGYLAFNGTNQYAPTTATLPTNTYTKMAWVYFTSLTSANNIISGSQGSNNGHAFWMGAGTTLKSGHNGDWSGTVGATVFSTNTWYHVACVFDSAVGMRLYVNGVQDAFNATKTATVSGTTNIELACYGSANFMYGRLASASIYNRALSANEIKQNFTALRGRFGV